VDQDFLVMKQVFERRVCSAYDYAWMVSLKEPFARTDREMQGIAWCSDGRCRWKQRKEAWRQLDAHRDIGVGIFGNIDEDGVERGGKGGDSHSTASQTLLTTSVINSISLY
jgi:hypothetical protein